MEQNPTQEAIFSKPEPGTAITRCKGLGMLYNGATEIAGLDIA